MINMFFCADDTVVINTPGTYKHEYAWLTSSNKYFIFQLKACKDAYLALTLTPQDTENSAYEIALGVSENTK